MTLLAIDGDVTCSVASQLRHFPDEASHVFVSCGGNDALQMIHSLNSTVSTVGEALEMMIPILDKFKLEYRAMLQAVLAKHQNITICTVYNQIPTSSANNLEQFNDSYSEANTISERALVALALFNEVILQEAIAQYLPIIDLRLVCDEPQDYSSISPIEPSGAGGEKIVRVINKVVNNHDFSEHDSKVYF